MIDIDMMILHVGEFGVYQKFLFIFQAPFCLFVTFVLFGQLFMTNYPTNHWCRDYVDLNCYNLSDMQRQNLSFPFVNGRYEFCEKYIIEENEVNISLREVNISATASCSRNLTALCNCTFSPTPVCSSLQQDSILDSKTKRRRRHYGFYGYWGPKTGFSDPIGQLYKQRTTPRSTTIQSRFTTTTTWTQQDDYNGSSEEFHEELEEIHSGRYHSPITDPPISTTSTTMATTTTDTTTTSIAGHNTRNPTRSTTSTSTPSILTETMKTEANGDSGKSTFSPLNSLYLNQDCSRRNINLSMRAVPNNTIFTGEVIRRNNWEINETRCFNWGFDPNHMDAPYVTIVTDPRSDWFCDPEMRNVISQALFFVGAICGGFLIGHIADTHGRLPALITANMFGCIGGALTALGVYSFPLFCFFRFITGFAFDNSFTMMYIIVLEYVGPTYRTLVANLSIAIFFTLGTILLPWLAILVMDWQIYALIISLPMILSLLSIWLVPESARWLLSKGRAKEATKILRQFAKVNGREVDEKIFLEFEEGAQKLYEEFSQEKEESLMDGLKRPKILKNFILLTIIWYIIECHGCVAVSMIALCYDGHSRNVLNFSVGDIFIRFTIASTTEFPADIFLIFTLDRAGRRFLAFASLVLSGAFSLISAIVPESPELIIPLFALTMVSRFFVNVAFNIGLQYAAELLPTVIRAQGVNSIHIMGYVAQIVSPYIASIGRTNRALALILLAIFSIIGGILSLFLPETLGEDLPNNLDEGEAFGKNQSFWSCPLWSKRRDFEEENVLPIAPKVTLRDSMRPSMRGETFRSSIISHGSAGSGHSIVLRRNRRVYLDPGTSSEKSPLNFRNTR